MDKRNLSADGYCDASGKKWSALIHEHPVGGGNGVLIWEKHGMSSQYNAETAMEAAWQRLQKENAA